MRLIVDAVLLRIKSGSHIENEQFAGSLAESRGILAYRDRVLVDDAVETHILVGERDPVFEGSQIIAESQIPGSLHAAEQYLLTI